MQQPPAKRQRVSNEMCPANDMGGCTKGDKCPLAHFEHELIKNAPPEPQPQAQFNKGAGGGGQQSQWGNSSWAAGASGQQQQQPPQQQYQHPQAVQDLLDAAKSAPVPPGRVGGIPPAGGGGAAVPKAAPEICWFHERGLCMKATGCKFSHDLSGSTHVQPAAGAGLAQAPAVPQDSGADTAAAWARALQSAGLAGGSDAMSGGASSEDLAQQALIAQYQQAIAGLQAQPEASTAIVASSTDDALAAGYDEQTIAALYQYQALQATLMAQGGGATDPYGSSQAETDAATNAAYSAAWAAALSNAGMLPSTASALSAGEGADADAALGAALASAAEYQRLLLACQQSGQDGMGSDAAAASVAGAAATRANHKMQLCKFYGEGKCSKGSFCPYAHGNEEVLAASLRSARTGGGKGEGKRNDGCYDFRDRGKCRFGITCKFSHNIEKV